MADAGPMIDTCFRRQMPEHFGGKEIEAPPYHMMKWNHSSEAVADSGRFDEPRTDVGRDDAVLLGDCELCGNRLDGSSVHFCEVARRHAAQFAPFGESF